MNKVTDNKLLARVALLACMVTMLIPLSQMPQAIAADPAPTISSIGHEFCDAGSIVEVGLSGANFQNGATVKLTRAGQADIVATDVIVDTSFPTDTQINCKFDFTGAVLGKWDVVVTNPDLQSCTQLDAFTVLRAFYFVEGYTGSNFLEFLCLGNPYPTETAVHVNYYFADGTSTAAGYSLAPLSRLTINVNSEVGEDKEVSIKAESESDFVAERPMYFIYQGAWSGSSDAVGATRESTTWYFAEGYTGPGFDEWLCLANFGETDYARVTVHYQTQEKGEISTSEHIVPVGTRLTIYVNDAIGPNYQTSIKIESNIPIVAERPMYFNYQGTGGWGWTGGHDVMGAPSLAKEYYFAEGTTRAGFEEWLTLQNPNATAIDIAATYQLGPDQGPNVTTSYRVEAGKRSTVYVAKEVGSEKDVSVKLTSESEFLAERPMYFDYTMGGADWTGGHCVIGATAQAKKWFFAEGYTYKGDAGEGFHEWLTLQNPGNEDADVTVTYYQESGTPISKKHHVPKLSRYNICVNVDAGENLSICTGIDSTKPLIVERPMYFGLGGGFDGGNDVVGYTP